MRTMARTTAQLNVTVPIPLKERIDDEVRAKYGGNIARGGMSEVVAAALDEHFSRGPQGPTHEAIPPAEAASILAEYDAGIAAAKARIPLFKGKVDKYSLEILNGMPPTARKYRLGDVVDLIVANRGRTQ